jgi:hypothetical protein
VSGTMRIVFFAAVKQPACHPIGTSFAAHFL